MQAHKKSAARPRRLSILVADDSVDTVLTLSTILRDEGHIVHTCANANLVVDTIRRCEPDVCILDIVMPGKTGFSIAREVVAMKLAKQPVLIAISGVFAKPTDKPLLLAAGFEHVLAKPARPDELVGLVDEIAGGGSPQSPA